MMKTIKQNPKNQIRFTKPWENPKEKTHIKKPGSTSNAKPGNNIQEMTKLTKGIGYAKLDSLQIAIPITECIYNGSAITKTTYEIDGDSVLIQERKNKASQEFERDGIKFTVRTQMKMPPKGSTEKPVQQIIFPMPSKILGTEKYDEGWTINNFEQGIQWMERTTGIKFKPEAWQNARFSDLDNAIDQLINDQKWNNELAELFERIEPKTRNEYLRIFKQKNGLISGYQLNTRNKEANRAVTHIHPFIKGYDKRLEIEEQRNAGNTWGIDYNPGERKRFESQIRNGYWTKSGILKTIQKPTTFIQLLTVYNDQNQIMTEYANKVLHEGYITLAPKPKIKRDMKQETPNEFIRNEMTTILKEQNNLPTGERYSDKEVKQLIKIRAIEAFGHKSGKASKIAKIIDEMWAITEPENDPSQTKLKL